MSDLLHRLRSDSWTVAHSALEEAERTLEDKSACAADALLAAVLAQAQHPKWEIRLLVARIGGLTRHPPFSNVLDALAKDDNQRVRKAALSSVRRRRSWGRTSALQLEHQQLVDKTLDKIDAQHGSQAADAALRASEMISSVVARELYHEALRLLTPIATSAERIAVCVTGDELDVAALKAEGLRLADRVKRLTRTLDAMRDFTAQPKLSFANTILRTIVTEGVQQVLDARTVASPVIQIDILDTISLHADRSRLIGAIVNVLANAVDAYEGRTGPPIEIGAIEESSHVTLVISDRGCGMTEEGRRDATKLFSSGKKGGTGFGLPLAVKIIESEHGGRLLLEGREGGGTVVKIVLPRRHEGTV